jgi:hypothetical protein
MDSPPAGKESGKVGGFDSGSTTTPDHPTTKVASTAATKRRKRLPSAGTHTDTTRKAASKTTLTAEPAAASPRQAPSEATPSKKAAPARRKLKPLLQLLQLPPHDGKDTPPPQAPFATATGEQPGALTGDAVVLRRIAEAQQAQGTVYWGVVESDFTARTGLSGQAVQQAIDAAPDHDVYYTNPSPHIEALFINAWHQGYTAHPRFAEATALILKAAGIDVAELDRLEPADRFVSGHCIFGNSGFWSPYLDFLDATVKNARANLTAEQLQWLDSQAADPRKLHHGATYWHFIVERLLPIFLRGPGKALRARRFDVPGRVAKLNGHQRRLREMKDVAHRTKSPWMYSCWLHYRNLYLLQIAGKQWCEANLPSISKLEVRFD